jgi:hypothetical protein
MSAAIVKHWFNQQEIPTNRKYCSVCKHTLPDDAVGSTECCGGLTTIDNNTIDFIGYTYGQPIPELSSYNSIIMCDISLPKEVMKELSNSTTQHVTWLDHHISAIRDNEEWSAKFMSHLDVTYAACELTWKYFFSDESMPEIVRLLGRYNCFGHKGTDEEQKVLAFQYGARSYIKNYEDAYKYLKHEIDRATDPTGLSMNDRILDSGVSVYEYLCAEAKQSYKNGFAIHFNDPNLLGYPENGGKGYNFICINKERFNPINFGIDYHKDGYDGCACFHIGSEGMVNFSLYNDNGEVDCSVIAKQFGGGGHKGVAGFRCDLETFNKIISSK